MARTVESQKSKVKSQKYSLNVCHLYPDLMDTYGDKGNILAIQYRCKQRDIEVIYSPLTISDKLLTNHYDFFFFGGGQDKAQIAVAQDLQKKKSALIKSVKSGAVLLSICGGYQLLQNHFKTISNQTIKGIGLFDAYTVGSTDRMIQNLLIKLDPGLSSEISTSYQQPLRESERNFTSNQLIGFENHSGKTYLGSTVKPLGTVIKGSGNNGEDKTEGAIYKNAFGCYLHGSLLPKNPHFADFLITKTLERRYGIVKLAPLDDTIEWQAHKEALKRSSIS